MKPVLLYRIDWPDSEPTAQTTDWAASQGKADAIARRAHPRAVVTSVTIPRDRYELVVWLQKNIWCEPGRAIARALDR